MLQTPRILPPGNVFVPIHAISGVARGRAGGKPSAQRTRLERVTRRCEEKQRKRGLPHKREYQHVLHTSLQF